MSNYKDTPKAEDDRGRDTRIKVSFFISKGPSLVFGKDIPKQRNMLLSICLNR